jgi:S-DNA-T family DNA segregation ATPase FtsK/SpoIIIE
MSLKNEIKNVKEEIQSLFTQLSKSVSAAEIWKNKCIEYAEQEHRCFLEESEMKYASVLSKLKYEYEENTAIISPGRHQLIQIMNYLAKDWDDPAWNKWSITNAFIKPEAVKFGQLIVAGHAETQTFPALLPLLVNGCSILFNASGAAKKRVVKACQSILLRLLAVVPPGKMQFTFIDPVALGDNVAPFMHLSDYQEKLVTSKVWSEKKHIEEQLSILTEHIGNVIQKYLRNQYATIEEYNEQAGEIAEPYRILVVMNFPVNFSDEAAQRLVSIVQNGARCGVYALILMDREQRLPYDFNINDLVQSTTVIGWTGKYFILEDPYFKEYELELDNPPDEKIFNRIVEEVGKAAIEASKVEAPFEKVLEKSKLQKENWWQSTTEDGIIIPLGPRGARDVQCLYLGKGTAQHALIAGKTGSGKSTLLHVLINTLTLKYSPDEVELYLIDFKKGVEFKTYATHQLPHARVIAIESEREFGLSVLEGLDVELKRRGDIFRNLAVDDLKDYRFKSKQILSRILLIVDEFQEFFVEDDMLGSKVSQILDRLVRQGRAFGIHVLLGSQTLAGSYTLSRSTINQMAVRIALICTDSDSRLILSDDNPGARLLSRPGEAIYNSTNGLIEGNNIFQVAWLSDEKRDRYLDEIIALAKDKYIFPPKSQTVFEGNAPARPEQNQALNDLLENPQWGLSLRRFSAWLGEPIAIKETTAASFLRQSGSNLLMVGQNDEAVIGMLINGILSLCAQYKQDMVKFYILDFGNVDAPHAHFLNLLPGKLPYMVIYGRSKQLPEIIEAITKELDERFLHEDESLNKKPSIYFIIYGLQRARDLEKEDSFSIKSQVGNIGETAPKTNYGNEFSKILREGPALGIHNIIWCDTYTNFQRRLDNRTLREFQMRVVLQMGEDDSTQLIDSKNASKLGQYRALFYNEEEGRSEKFRPFALPEEGWLIQVGEKFKKN